MAWSVVTGLHHVHRLWRWFRKGTMYGNSNNAVFLTAGHITAFFAQNSLTLKITARILLIATRIQECANRQMALTRSFHRWLNALTGKYLPESHRFTYPCLSLCSPSTAQYLQQTFYHTKERVVRIAQATFDLLKKVFRLSMHLIDAVEAFLGTPEAQQDSMNELYLNAKNCLGVFLNNTDFLYEQLIDKHDAIDEVLEVMNVPHTAEKLIQSVKGKIKKKNHLNQKKKEAITEIGRRFIWEMAFSVGLDDFLPGEWVPNYDFSVQKAICGKWDRYPKTADVRRLPLT